MKVVHVSRTRVSGAPETLSRALDLVPGIRSVYANLHKIQANPEGLGFLLQGADIIHWHNHINPSLYNSLKHLKHVIHYHSEPSSSDIFEIVDRIPSHFKKLTLPHYHSSLQSFKDCEPIRNVVDISPEDLIHPSDYTIHADRLMVAYSYSHTASWGVWQRKGKRETQNVMERVINHFRGKIDVRFDLIEGASYRECLYRKSSADIILDECVTPSYHLSSLEGLAVGRPTICWIDDRVENALLKCSGAKEQPFHSVYIGWLEDYLIDMIEKGPEYIKSEGKKAKRWFDKYWSIQDVIKDYINVYHTL